MRLPCASIDRSVECGHEFDPAAAAFAPPSVSEISRDSRPGLPDCGSLRRVLGVPVYAASADQAAGSAGRGTGI